MPDLLDNTPWWVPGVTTGGAAGMVLQRCTAYGDMDKGGPRHLEGGFYGLDSLGPHYWQCKARSDGRFRMECRCQHRGQPQHLCSGHVQMIRKRGSGVCPACVHPPQERALQESMERIRRRPELYPATAPSYEAMQRAQRNAVSELWGLQAALDELVERGIAHRCPLTLTEIS